MIPYRASSSAALLALTLHKSPKPMWMGRSALVSPINVMSIGGWDCQKSMSFSQTDIEKAEKSLWSTPWRMAPTSSLISLRLMGLRLEHTMWRMESMLRRFCLPNLHILAGYSREQVFYSLHQQLLMGRDVHHYMDFFGPEDLRRLGMQVEEAAEVPNWMKSALQ